MNQQVMILYNQTDEAWKEEIEKHIRVLIKAGYDLDIDLWDELRLDSEKDWYAGFESSLDRAGVIILAASKDFINSRLMLSDKVRKRLKEKQEGGFPILIVLVNKCDWKRFPWLKTLPIFPGKGKLLSDLAEPAVDSTLAELTQHIVKALKLQIYIPEGILAYLQLNEVGPVKQLIFEPNRRLNIITGDNSFGKTLLLECAWWVLAGKWPKYPASPREDAATDDVKIKFQLKAKSGSKGKIETISYDRESSQWLKPNEDTGSPGLVIYARADGSFTVHDPVRAKRPPPGKDARPFSPIIFDKEEIENGIIEKIPDKGIQYNICNGLVYDWVNWQRKTDSPFEVFKKILNGLSTASQDLLMPGEPVRVPGDSREMPSLIHPYGTVPFVHAAASVKRLISLAYLILWTWEEHKIACRETKKAIYKSMVVLIDEVESHLHPQWQRSIVPSLLEVKKYLDKELDIQFLITTHSPLVLASSEPVFEEENDKLFHLDIRDDQLVLAEQPFLRHGRVDNWFTSETFGLFQARSLEAEKAIRDAKNLQQKEDPTREEIEEVHRLLVRLLGDFDTFWPRWTFFAEQHGVEV